MPEIGSARFAPVEKSSKTLKYNMNLRYLRQSAAVMRQFDCRTGARAAQAMRQSAAVCGSPPLGGAQLAQLAQCPCLGRF